jgi:hypothetical protein
MVLALDSKGLVYMHISPRCGTINAKYIMMALGMFMTCLKKKKPEMVEGTGFSIRTIPLSTAPPLSGIGWPPE